MKWNDLRRTPDNKYTYVCFYGDVNGISIIKVCLFNKVRSFLSYIYKTSIIVYYCSLKHADNTNMMFFIAIVRLFL